MNVCLSSGAWVRHHAWVREGRQREALFVRVVWGGSPCGGIKRQFGGLRPDKCQVYSAHYKTLGESLGVRISWEHEWKNSRRGRMTFVFCITFSVFWGDYAHAGLGSGFSTNYISDETFHFAMEIFNILLWILLFPAKFFLGSSLIVFCSCLPVVHKQFDRNRPASDLDGRGGGHCQRKWADVRGQQLLRILVPAGNANDRVDSRTQRWVQITPPLSINLLGYKWYARSFSLFVRRTYSSLSEDMVL